MNRVEAIIFHEHAADALQATRDEHRWDAARLIAEELASGKSQRQLGEEIGRDHKHVARMAKVWRTFGDPGPHGRPSFSECYRQAKAGLPPMTLAELATQIAGFDNSMVPQLERGEMTMRQGRDLMLGVDLTQDELAEYWRGKMRTAERAATTLQNLAFLVAKKCPPNEVQRLKKRLLCVMEDLGCKVTRASGEKKAA